MKRLIAAVTLALAACTPALATEIGGEWHLVGIEGQRAPAPLSITFTTEGKISGKAPCNRFFGSYTGTLPAISLSPLGATKMACDKLEVEAIYFEALQAMTQAEVDQDHLLLIGAEGRVLEFARDPADDSCLTCGD